MHTPSISLGRALIPVGAALSLFPFVTPAWALVMGVVLALSVGNPYVARTRRFVHPALSASVMGLGAAMNLIDVVRVGRAGFFYTLIGISAALASGLLLARALKVKRNTGILISVGTAICGGSAIAAIAPVIGADDDESSVALGTVFLLNAFGLAAFPIAGHWLGLGQETFGLWAALAIHDTSSVVGAAMRYGDVALRVATTVKLARALWIVPLTLAMGYWSARSRGTDAPATFRKPWFILGFVGAAALVTFVPALAPMGHIVARVAKQGLVLTLFFIGANFTPAAVRAVGLRPLAQGVLLWAFVTGLSLGIVLH